MAHLQARPDRTRLYGMLKGVGLAALAAAGYIVAMKSIGHFQAAEFDKRAAQIAAPCEPQPIGAETSAEADPCL